MNPYEVLLMLDPELTDERQNEIIARLQEIVAKGGGVWGRTEPWGKRKLAYEIDKKGEAYYHLLTFDCEPGGARRARPRAAHHGRCDAPHGRAGPQGLGPAPRRRRRGDGVGYEHPFVREELRDGR